MCGIVGYVGHRNAVPVLIQALKDLEYRGYDSAGIAVLAPQSEHLVVIKREGKLSRLEAALADAGVPSATLGIGHTRWATHGRPADHNAHPHTSCHGEVVVIHNGIVENYAQLRAELVARGHRFASETDTETIAHLMEERVAEGYDLLDALRAAAARLEGSQAVVAASPREPSALVAARLGNAGGVVIGLGDGEFFLSSDLPALLPHTQRVVFLEDRHFARVTAESVTVVDLLGRAVDVPIHTVSIDPSTALKGPYPHFMLKEMLEQPEALSDTIRSFVTFEPPTLHLDDVSIPDARLQKIERVVLIGMGTSLHAAMVGRQFVEQIARLPAEADNASEFRHREPVIDARTLVVSVTQSGETVDVLEAMAVASRAGALQVVVCNTEGSQATRVADGTVYTRAGIERCVASTKCFTTALAALYGLALWLGQARRVLAEDVLQQHLRELMRVPDAVARALELRGATQRLAQQLVEVRSMLYLGRGLAYPVAIEGALKMKEVSYIHAEGYAAGEMKHGPIALVEPDLPTVAVAPKHALRMKMAANIEQVRARGGRVITVVTEGDEELTRLSDESLEIPEVGRLVEPIVAVVPLQLLAYETAVARGCDVDQPRNLAKTVTVE